MDLKLNQIEDIKNQSLQITGSKSEANRLLILQALYPGLGISNLSNSDDSKVMQKALASSEVEVDVHHAGTAMRFLTAYFAIKDSRETVLTGSKRMQERPIKILVDALRQLGAQITYEKQEGYPPIRIQGTTIEKSKVTLQATVSSQYISALMLIAPSLKNGLEIILEGKITSIPYIKMTLSLLKEIGVSGSFNQNTITIAPKEAGTTQTLVVESDWSSASYFYSLVALSKNATVTLDSYKKDSYQGDSSLAEIYKKFGVTTAYNGTQITLSKNPSQALTTIEDNALDLSNSPDIAQTIAVTSFGLGMGCYLTGLHTLKIKETDRLEALKAEIEKLGGHVVITEDSLRLAASSEIRNAVTINTYDDHRMAMAFAPLALRTELNIADANVVTKSYPDFWTDMKQLGFVTTEL